MVLLNIFINVNKWLYVCFVVREKRKVYTVFLNYNDDVPEKPQEEAVVSLRLKYNAPQGEEELAKVNIFSISWVAWLLSDFKILKHTPKQIVQNRNQFQSQAIKNSEFVLNIFKTDSAG